MNPVSQRLLGALQSLAKGASYILPKRPGGFDEELIDSRIEIHDSNHFEVKLDYTIDPAKAANRYRVEVFLFTPLSLGITYDTYGKKQFYRDIQAYIRFKTPSIPLAALLNTANEASPLTRLGRVIPTLVEAPKSESELRMLGSDMKLLGCLVRAHVRAGSPLPARKFRP